MELTLHIVTGLRIHGLVIDLAEQGEGAAPMLTPLQQVVRWAKELVETEQSHVKVYGH